MERGVVCEVTPIRLLIEGDDLLGVQRTCRGISVITPLPFGGGVGGGATILWARNCAQDCSVNSVRSVREKPPQRVVCVLYHTVGAFYFSQIYTDEQNTQRATETLSQPISQNLTAIFSSNAL